MENASKALLMAGGMLISIIVISIFIMACSHISELQQSKVETQLKGEVQDFNNQYLVFNKNAMYGVDVISALNLAISNNQTNNVNPGEEFYVDVSFKLKEDIQDEEYKYTFNGSKYDKGEPNKSGDYNLEKGKFYKLSTNSQTIQNFLGTVGQNEETKTFHSNGIDYTIKYSGIANFKRRTFKCSAIRYNSDGRISELEFQQR